MSADDRANLIVVSATAESMPLVEQLIELLDQKPVSQEVRVVKLQHTTGNDLVRALYQVVRSWPRSRNEPMPTVSATTSGSCHLPPEFDGLLTVTDAQSVTCSLVLEWPEADLPCGGTPSYMIYRSTAGGDSYAQNHLAHGRGRRRGGAGVHRLRG